MDLDITNKDLKKQVKTFKDNITKEAEDLIKEFFPRKCIELDSFLKDEDMQLDSPNLEATVNIPIPELPATHVNHNEAGDHNQTKKRKLSLPNNDLDLSASKLSSDNSKVLLFPCGTVTCNEKILKLTQKIKPEILLLIEKCNTVRMWVTLLIPKIEDGNNFGVSIQEETLSELRQVESETASYLDQISKYFYTRGQIVCKIAKYPHTEDYRQFIREVDEKQLLSIRLMTAELRNHYSTLHDMIVKNIEKIKKPRNVNISGMY